jgi:hypothetical protein
MSIMNKSSKQLCTATSIATVLLAGCAGLMPDEAATWNIPPAGSSWVMSQRNTGSYGKDAEVQVTRGDSTWQGNKVVTLTMASTGGSIIALPSGKWQAVVSKEGKTLFTYDPPIGYEYPLQVGKTWKTRHRITNHTTGRVLEFDYNCVVEKFEPVTVRAGTFDTFKIVCENEYSRDVSWTNPKTGLNIKTDFLRKPANPSGEGTQQTELATINLAK